MQCENCGKKVYANEKCSCGQKAPKKSNGVVLTNTIICMFLLIIIVFSLIITLSLRTVINRNMLVEAIEKVELSDIEIDDRKLDEYIYDEFIDDKRVSVKNVDNLLEKEFIKDFITEKVEAYQDYFLDEGDMPYITSDDIIELIEDNSDVIYKEVGLRFLEKDKEELRKNLSDLDSFKEDSADFFDSSFGSAVAQTYFSYVNIIFLIIMMAVIFIQWLIVYLLSARRISKMILKYGIAVAVPSFIVLAASVIAKIAGGSVDMVDKLLGSSIYPFMLFSAVMFVIGLVMAVPGIIVNKNYKKKIRAAAAASIDNTGVVPDNYELSDNSGDTEQYDAANTLNEQTNNNVNTHNEQFYELADTSDSSAAEKTEKHDIQTASAVNSSIQPPNGMVNQGRVQPPNGMVNQGRVQPPNGMVNQGRVQPPNGMVNQGRVQPPNGAVNQGRVQPPNGAVNQGRVQPPNVMVNQGRVQPPNGAVNQGRVQPPNGAVNQGRVQPPNGAVNQGRVQPPNGAVNQGRVQSGGIRKNICPNCSYENKDIAAFCCKCGTRLK